MDAPIPLVEPLCRPSDCTKALPLAAVPAADDVRTPPCASPVTVMVTYL